jgi:peptidyl-tRNA hydrolase, PTH1 family
MRIGIGPLPENADSADFVLERFTKPEQNMLDTLLPHYENAVITAVTQGLEVAMNQFNGRILE